MDDHDLIVQTHQMVKDLHERNARVEEKLDAHIEGHWKWGLSILGLVGISEMFKR